MARVLGVSPSGDYAWRTRERSAREASDVAAERARASDSPTQRWDLVRGAPRIHAERAAEGVPVSRKRVARVMREAGLAGGSRRKGPRTTRRAPQARPAPDLVERRFEADAPDRRWVADYPLRPERRRIRVLGHRARRVQPPGGGLGDGSSPAHRAGPQRAGYGARTTTSHFGHPPLRPTLPVHLVGLRRALPAVGRGAVDGRRRWARSGTATTTPWPRASSPPWNASCPTGPGSMTTAKHRMTTAKHRGRVRLHRGMVSPAPPSPRPGLPVTDRLRKDLPGSCMKPNP